MSLRYFVEKSATIVTESFFAISVLTEGGCKRLLCLVARAWIRLKTDLRRRSSKVGHFRTSSWYGFVRLLIRYAF